MDTIKSYHKIIQSLFEQYLKDDVNGLEEFETQVIIDQERGHYLLVDVGWEKMSRAYTTIIHLDVKGDKIWVQKDFTEKGIANELFEQGIPKSKIVLAFQAPIKRPYTEFAVA